MPKKEKANRSRWSTLPRFWRTLIIAGLGVVAGLGLVVANVSRAVSYLSDDPETCVNCHVMNTQYATWQHSSHFNNATCNDCHVPHDNLINHYFFKAKDGLRHASMFALRLEPQVIRLSHEAVDVIQDNCSRCHAHQLQTVTMMRSNDDEGLKCWECHREVPHGTVRSLSTTPEPMRPRLPKPGLGMSEMTIGSRKPRAEEIGK